MNLKGRRDCTKLNLHIILKIMLAYLGSVLNIMMGAEMRGSRTLVCSNNLLHQHLYHATKLSIVIAQSQGTDKLERRCNFKITAIM